jgi:ornithine cyclodeaminase/alanine dehydrogenase-like protein (mu-crystallin family)
VRSDAFTDDHLEPEAPMDVLIADQKQVTALLPMDEAIAVMRRALGLLDGGDVLLPLRSMLALPDGDRVMGLMPSYLGGIDALGVKVIAAFPANFGSEYDTHQGVVLVFDTERGLLRAIVDATSITAIRTAAVSGVATDLLARSDAGDLAIIGAGTQAHTHLQAMRCVRPVRRVRVFSVPEGSAEAFAEREERLTGLPIEVAASAQEAVRGADLICTVTTATEPVLRGAWLAPGAHINAVGAYTPTTRELDTEAVARARLYVDRREAALSEAGEFLLARAEGAVDDGHIVGEIGEVLVGKVAGRGSPGEITLFKSLGIAIEDLAAARYVYDKAQEKGVGTWVEIGGRHFGAAAAE